MTLLRYPKKPNDRSKFWGAWFSPSIHVVGSLWLRWSYGANGLSYGGYFLQGKKPKKTSKNTQKPTKPSKKAQEAIKTLPSQPLTNQAVSCSCQTYEKILSFMLVEMISFLLKHPSSRQTNRIMISFKYEIPSLWQWPFPKLISWIVDLHIKTKTVCFKAISFPEIPKARQATNKRKQTNRRKRRGGFPKSLRSTTLGLAPGSLNIWA